MRIPAYLRLSRHGIYYFRIVVPKALRPWFSGRSEVKVSLHTRDLREAMLHARNLALAAHQQFRYADGMSVQPVDPNDPSTWPKAGDPNIRKFAKVIETVHSPEGMIERVKYKVDSTSPVDVAAARADEMLHHKRQRFMRQPNSPEAQAFFEAEEEELRRSLMADAELAEARRKAELADLQARAGGSADRMFDTGRRVEITAAGFPPVTQTLALAQAGSDLLALDSDAESQVTREARERRNAAARSQFDKYKLSALCSGIAPKR